MLFNGVMFTIFGLRLRARDLADFLGLGVEIKVELVLAGEIVEDDGCFLL